MFPKLLTSALFAGLAAGLIAAVLQFTFVIPTLLEGELYETGERVHFSASGSPQSESHTPEIGSDWRRHGLTVTFNIVTFVGFAFVGLAIMAIAEMRGLTKITAKQGLIWGMAGFITMQLAPGFGLAPELPGTPAPEIGPRQIWWISTVAATGVGLWLIAFGRSYAPWFGAILLLIPHLIGAPHLDTYFGVAPPELSAHFVALSLGTTAASWALLGFFAAYFWERSEA